MVYIDTSVIVKLYIKEEYSQSASNWVKKNDEAIPLTTFHELEFINALNLKAFRNEITKNEIKQITSRLENHEEKGIYYRPPVDWSAVFTHAIEISKKHSTNIGSRSLDILHIATSLSIRSDRFLTLDDRQINLATLFGLRIVDIRR